MGLAALLAWRSVETLYLDTQRENLLAQAELTAAALQGQPLPTGAAEPYSQFSNIQPGIHTRLLGEQGAVIYSLPVLPGPVAAPELENSPPITPEELLARPEIASAAAGTPAASLRRVAGKRVLYAAAPVAGQDGSPVGIVYLTMPVPASGLPPGLVWRLGGAALGASLVALLAGALLARRVVAPVEEIAHAAEAVSAGDLDQRVADTGPVREIGSLGGAFNQMTASLRQANQAKNAFVADVTHELRTPLTVIKGTIETLEDGGWDDLAGRGPLLASMQRETDRLIRLVNDLLVLTRADAGTLHLALHPLDLDGLARDRCVHLGGLAARVGVRLEVGDGPAVWVTGDEDRLAQVLDNLLDNAIRYSPPGSAVTVEITWQAGTAQALCRVRDCGPGIEPNHLPFLFDRFYRTDPSRNRQTGGAGLGLAIVKALVLAQGGQTGVESAPGAGTAVWFTLPAAEVEDIPPEEGG